jgi:thioredoxin-related protein
VNYHPPEKVVHKTSRSLIRPCISLLGFLLCWSLATTAAESTDAAQRATPFELPAWFKTSFLDLKEDVAEAAATDKRLLLYIGQDGCPYCRELMQNNFTQKPIVDYTRKHFDVLAINLWGDAEVTDFNDQRLSEKEFARQLKVQFTPTLLFFDEQGKVVLRLNGYLPPHQFMTALQFVAGHKEKTTSFREYYASLSPAPATGKLHSAPSMLQPPYTLTRSPTSKPLLVLFEQKVCGECDVLHQKILTQDTSRALLKKLDVVLLDMWSATPVVAPDGKNRTASAWARELGLVYAPGAVLFGPDGREIIRIEGMLKAFHVQSVLDYAASGAYLRQPEFQRYVEERAAAMREKGVVVEIW